MKRKAEMAAVHITRWVKISESSVTTESTTKAIQNTKKVVCEHLTFT